MIGMISLKPFFDTHSGEPASFSPKYTAEQAASMIATREGRIDLFHDFYSGWYLNPLQKMVHTEVEALIALSSLLSLCDVIEQFERGERSTPSTTGEFVKAALRDIYAENISNSPNPQILEVIVEKLYKSLRNG